MPPRKALAADSSQTLMLPHQEIHQSDQALLSGKEDKYIFRCNCSGLLFLTHRFFVKTEKIIFLFCLEISMFVDNSGSYLYMKP